MTRKEILPKWIRFFSWIYLLMFLAPVVFLFGLIGSSEVNFTIFGLSYEGTTSLHPIAFIITLIATLSATVAYGILWGRDWAPLLGIIYGVIGLITCGISLYLHLGIESFYIPLEPILLIPFIIILYQKKREWENYPNHDHAEQDAAGQSATAE